MNREVQNLFDFGDADENETISVIAGSVAGISRVAEEDIAEFLYPNPIVNGEDTEAEWANDPLLLANAITAAKALVQSAPDLSQFNVGDEGDRRALINYASAALLDMGFERVTTGRDHSAIGLIVREFIRRARQTATSRSAAYRVAILRSLGSLASRLIAVVRANGSTDGLASRFATEIAQWAREVAPAVVQEIRDIVQTTLRSSFDNGRWFADNYMLTPVTGQEARDGNWLVDGYRATGVRNAGPARVKQALKQRLAELSPGFRVENRRLVRADADMTFTPEEAAGDGEADGGQGTPASGEPAGSGGADPQGGSPNAGIDGSVESPPLDGGGRDDAGSGSPGEGQGVGSGGSGGLDRSRTADRLRELATLSGLSVRNLIRKLELEVLLGLTDRSVYEELRTLYSNASGLQVDDSV